MDRQKLHKKTYSENCSLFSKENIVNLALELPQGLNEEKKSAFFYKNSVLQSIISDSQGSKLSLNQEERKNSTIFLENHRNSLENERSITVTSFKAETPEKKHDSQRKLAKSLRISHKIPENNAKSSVFKEISVNKPENSPKTGKDAHNFNNFPNNSSVNQTIFLDNSSNFFNSLYVIYNETRIPDAEAFNESLYMRENEKIIENFSYEAEKTGRIALKAANFLGNLRKFAGNLLHEELIITKELLKKSLDKLDSENLPTFLHFSLISLRVCGYKEHESEAFIEYAIEFTDKMLDKAWKFYTRYSKLRNLYLETKYALALEGKSASFPRFPSRTLFPNKNPQFLEARKRRLQAFLDNYLGNSGISLLMEKGILRSFLFREIWAQNLEDFRGKLAKVAEMKENELLKEIRETLERNKVALELEKRNEALFFIYYRNKLKRIQAQNQQ